MSGGGGSGGNREVPPDAVLGARGDLRAARVEACPEEGGSWERYASWDDTSEPEASDAQPATPQTSAAARAYTSAVLTSPSTLRFSPSSASGRPLDVP